MPKSTKTTIVALTLLLTLVATSFALQAQDKPAKSLNSFRIMDVDGVDRALTDKAFEGKPLALVFLSDWSGLSHDLMRMVMAEAGSFDGVIVPVCAGESQRVRATRQALDPEGKLLWLHANATTASTFSTAFDGTESMTYVPALLIVDSERRVRRSHIGEMTAEAVKAALAQR